LDCILTLDIGSSSARALLFGMDGHEVPGFESHVPYRASTTQSGGWEIAAADLTQIAAQALDPICSEMRSRKIRPAAVAIDTFWHSILGVAEDDKAVTPVLHPFDSRSADAAKKLAFDSAPSVSPAQRWCAVSHA
jgi:gluconokinase